MSAVDGHAALEKRGEEVRALLDALPRTSRGRRHALDARIPVATILLACELVEASGMVEQFEQWLEERRKSNAGRKAMVPVKAFFVAQFACSLARVSVAYTHVHHVLVGEMDRTLRQRLGFPVAEKCGSKRQWKKKDQHLDHTRRKMSTSTVYRRANALAATVDPKVYPVHRGLLREEVAAIDENRDPADVAEKQRRADLLPAELLLATYFMLPEDVRQRWDGDITLDGTTVRAGNQWGHGAYGRANKGAMSPEVNAGMHMKDPDSRDRSNDHKIKKAVFGYELHLGSAVVNGNDDRPHHFPDIVLAMTVDRPGTDPGQNAVTAAKHIAHAGLPTGAFIVDRGYSQMAAQDFHLPLKALGYDGVWDYKSTDYGIQSGLHGLQVVEGNLYGPCLPPHLVDATSRLQAGGITDEEYAELIEQRRAYRARVKTESDGRTSATFRCPGAGSHRTVKCDLKPVSARQENLEIGQRKTLPLAINTPVDPPKCCTNKESVSIPPDFAAKYLQREHYGSPEWKKYYSHPRNSIEGKNNYLKAADLIDIGEAGKRRFRGYGKQLIAFVLMTAAANVHTIMNWLEEHYAHENDAPAKLGRPAATGLEAYQPDINTPQRIVGSGGQLTRAG